MRDEPMDIVVEADPDHDLLTVRVRHAVVSTLAAVDQAMTPIEAVMRTFPRPYWVLFDMSGLYISPRVRDYVNARAEAGLPLPRATFGFGVGVHPLTELVIRTGALYAQTAYVFCPGEADARVALARHQAAPDTPLADLGGPEE